MHSSQKLWPKPNSGNSVPCILPCKIGFSWNLMKERYLSKTPFLTFVYLSRYNINLPCIFGNFEGRFFMNRSSPVTGGQGCKFPYITAFGSLLLPQLKKCKMQLQHIFLPMKAAARQELGVWGSIAKPFCREASPKVTQRSGVVMNTPL